jgi:urea carboxylase-associated protein 2
MIDAAALALDSATPEQHRERYLRLREAARLRAAAAPHGAPGGGAVTAIPESAALRHEIIPAGWYWSATVRRGEALRIVNPGGAAAVSAMLWHAAEPSERFNAGDTVKLQWSARLGRGKLLFSDMGRVLAAIIDDTTDGRHDALTGGSTPASNRRRYGDSGLRNTRDNFRLAAAKLGLSVRDVPPCITFFAGVRTDAEGRFVWHGPGTPGESVDLRAELDLFVALSNCPHPLDPTPEYGRAPIEATIWRAPPPAADDPCRNGGEEAARGYENTDAYCRA